MNSLIALLIVTLCKKIDFAVDGVFLSSVIYMQIVKGEVQYPRYHNIMRFKLIKIQWTQILYR